MRKLLVILAALTALASPAAAFAQTQKPDPFVIEENRMGGRSPRVAADKLVAPDTGGELIGVRGRAWWQVLAHCAGIYRFHDDEMRKAGNIAEADAAKVQGRYFVGLAVDRLKADRKLSSDATVEILVPEASYGYTTAADGGETYRPFAVEDMRCRDVAKRYKAAGLGY